MAGLNRCHHTDTLSQHPRVVGTAALAGRQDEVPADPCHLNPPLPGVSHQPGCQVTGQLQLQPFHRARPPVLPAELLPEETWPQGGCFLAEARERVTPLPPREKPCSAAGHLPAGA